MTSKSYSEPEKKIAREEAIKFAVSNLTIHRFKATIARKNYVREVRDHLMEHGTDFDYGMASELSEGEISHWEQFYMSTVGKKKPADLKVAYLSGPNPLNDLRVFTENGILPENVWAFESDNKTYNQAIIAALESEFPFVKIHKGSIEHYFQVLHQKFDIVYLDFCGTITSNQTLSVVRELFRYQKLQSPGVLITNFALPERRSDPKFWNGLIKLSANYLFPKSFTESYKKYGGGFTESAEAEGLSFEDFFKIARKNPHTFYSQFITRVLFDLPSVLVPYQRLAANKTLVDTFFRKFTIKELPKDRIEDIVNFPNDNSLIWGLGNFNAQKGTFLELLSKFRKQIAFNANENQLIEVVQLLSFLTGEDVDESYYSEKLKKISKDWRPFKKYIFCDVFLFHQLKDLLIGQLTAPYQYNIARTKRWTYKAKTNRMFMDAITYDECRYIFDWMPTLDMFEEGINDLDRQLTLRFALDSIAKQRRWYNDEFLSGTAILDDRTRYFRAKELKKREIIN